MKSVQSVVAWTLLAAVTTYTRLQILHPAPSAQTRDCHVIRFHGTRVSVLSFTVKKKIVASPAPIFMKVTAAQLCFVPILYTEFCPNRTINVKNTDGNTSMPLG